MPSIAHASATASLRRRARRVVGQVEEGEHEAEPVGLDGRAERSAASRAKKRTRDGQEHAGAVARQAVGRDGTAVAHARETREGQVDDLPARSSGLVGDEPDAARIELESVAWRPRLGAAGASGDAERGRSAS